MKEKRRSRGDFLYVALTVVILLVFGLVNREFRSMPAVLAGLSLRFIVLAVLMTGVFLVIEGEIIRLLLWCQGERVGFWTTLKIGLIGIYYSYIRRAPRAASRCRSSTCCAIKVPAGNSTAVLFVKFFAYPALVRALHGGLLDLRVPAAQGGKPQLIPIILVGIAVNGLWIVAIPLLFCAPVLHGVMQGIVWLLERCRFLKKRAQYIEKVRGFENDFASYTEKFRHKKRYYVYAVPALDSAGHLQMSVLYVVFRAFSYDLPYLELLCMQTMLQASVCFVPLPGASGAQELGFSMFFSSYFASGDVLYTAVLVWRFFTYYIVVILGALLVVADQIVMAAAVA